MGRLLLLCLFAGVLPLHAQAVIDPGMSKARVIALLGKPLVERTTGESAYLFYRNSCQETCGMNDVVILQMDAVVDAIFRSSSRRFSGTSSSPRAIPAAEARKAKPTKSATSNDSTLVLPLVIKAIKQEPHH